MVKYPFLRARRLISLASALLVVLAPGSLHAQDVPDYLAWANPGPYRSADPADFALNSFRANQPIVGTYFFYWFDAATLRAAGEQFPVNPVDDQTQSFFSAAW